MTNDNTTDETKKEITNENMKRIVLVLVICSILLFINFLLLKEINRREKGRTNRRPLRDKLHECTKEIHQQYGHLFIILIDVLLYGVFALVLYTVFKEDKEKVWMDFLPKLVFLFYCRLLCIWVTEIPTSMDARFRTLMSPITVDHMFSSHTMFFLASLMYLYYFYRFSPVIVGVLTFVYGFFIISCREHYTIDVVVSILITYLMFKEYMKEKDIIKKD